MIATILIFLVIFFVIVMGHELGHFLLAKLSGIRVNEFSIGMGPRLVGFRRNGTEYALRLIPIGGACVFEGEDGKTADKGAAAAGETRSGDLTADAGEAAGGGSGGNFNDASVWARILTVAAGPVFNFLLAFLFGMVVAGYAGADLPVLGGVAEGSSAQEAGLQAGDRITRFGGRIYLAREVQLEMELNRDGEPVEVEYERDGRRYTTVLTPRYDETEGRYLVGFVNYARYVEAKGINRLRYGWYELRFCMKNTLMSVRALLQGQLSRNDVAGPVGMAQIVNEVREESAPGGPLLVFINMVNIAMLLSVSLGVMNLLPLPALDGGRLVFLLLEVVRGKPVPPEKEGFVHFVGFVLLMVLMVLVLFNDVARLIR